MVMTFPCHIREIAGVCSSDRFMSLSNRFPVFVIGARLQAQNKLLHFSKRQQQHVDILTYFN